MELISGWLRACSGRKNCAQIMHTTHQFLYSKGKIHTSYFKSDGIWGSGFREVYPPRGLVVDFFVGF